MPNELTDLELDEVSLVGKAANGKRFLLYKSANGSVPMTKTKPARADKAGARALVSKADLNAMINVAVRKAVEPIAEENRILKSTVERQTALLEDKEFVAIAKSDFSELGVPEEVATVLKSLKGMKPEERKPVLQILKRASVMKAEAGKLLYHPMGSDRPAPGTSMAEFEALVAKHEGIIQKSGSSPTDPKVRHALAVAAATRENGALAKSVLAEERAGTMRAQMGVI